MRSLEDTRLLGFRDVKSTLLQRTENSAKSEEFKSLRIPLTDDTQERTIHEWLNWCRSHPDLQLVEAVVPSSIIPGAALVDVRVGTGTGRRRQRDDVIYNDNEDVRRWVARGNCVLRLPGQRHLCLIHALKKFTGGIGDEDDDAAGGNDSTWQRYFLRPVEDATRVVVTQKADGEVAHLSAHHVDGAFLLCIGSKNVHMVVRRESDIALYDGQRYRVAREVAAAVWRLLAAMEDQQRQLLLSFLHHTRFTAVMELLQPDHQSIEDLSHLREAELCFITWAPTFSREPESFCGCSPELGFQLANTLGMKTVEHYVAAGDVLGRLPGLTQEIRKGCGYEGKVIYFVDDDNNVIGLLKKKTAWYMLLRALRDLLCSGLKKLSIEDLEANIEKRFRSIQVLHGFDSQFVGDWLSLAIAFAKWLKDNPATKYSTFRFVMPPLWSQFLRFSGRTDNINLNAYL